MSLTGKGLLVQREFKLMSEDETKIMLGQDLINHIKRHMPFVALETEERLEKKFKSMLSPLSSILSNDEKQILRDYYEVIERKEEDKSMMINQVPCEQCTHKNVCIYIETAMAIKTEILKNPKMVSPFSAIINCSEYAREQAQARAWEDKKI